MSNVSVNLAGIFKKYFQKMRNVSLSVKKDLYLSVLYMITII